MLCLEEKIDKIARVQASIAYSTFTKFQHAGANKTRLVKILESSIKRGIEQVKYELREE